MWVSLLGREALSAVRPAAQQTGGMRGETYMGNLMWREVRGGHTWELVRGRDWRQLRCWRRRQRGPGGILGSIKKESCPVLALSPEPLSNSESKSCP